MILETGFSEVEGFGICWRKSRIVDDRGKVSGSCGRKALQILEKMLEMLRNPLEFDVEDSEGTPGCCCKDFWKLLQKRLEKFRNLLQ
ncbi:UNVERIFIED_CONTAM: hypothetical protein PYX00_004463 [Menopon gallinae]|uniref:Uncharacterized protein n=1 Tax=Menopon gallinae TaxID=328185 RepID=A0AAW2I5S2_9NEOP